MLVGGEKIFCLEIKAHPDSSNSARGGRRKRCVRALLKTVVFIAVFFTYLQEGAYREPDGVATTELCFVERGLCYNENRHGD